MQQGVRGSGGGEAQLTASWDVAVARPVCPPTSQPVVVRLDEVRVSVVMVDGTRSLVDGALSAGSDSMSVVAADLQRDSWICSGSGLPLRRRDAVGVDGALSIAGGPATVFRSDTVE